MSRLRLRPTLARMKSIRYALVATLAIAFVLVVFGALSAHAAAIYKPGVELALGWRVALYVQNQLVVFLLLNFVVIGAAAAWLWFRSPRA